MGNANSVPLEQSAFFPQLLRAELLFGRPKFGSAFGVHTDGDSFYAGGMWFKPVG